MENENKRSGEGYTGGDQPLGLSPYVVVPVATPGAEMLSDSPTPKTSAGGVSEHTIGSLLRRMTPFKWGLLALAVMMIAGSVVLVVSLRSGNRAKSGANTANQYTTVELPLGELKLTSITQLTDVRNVVVNGTLKVKGGFVIAPSVQPATPEAGQLYFDQFTNSISYYNGSQYVSLLAHTGVDTLGGLSGQIGLGVGLASGSGRLTNTGVLSVQGQVGNVVFTPGNGISIDGTTITNNGVVSVSSSSPSLTVSDDGNGNVTLTPNGAGTGTVASFGGTAGRIAKFTGAQDIADSLISEAGATVTVGGNLSVTGSLALGSALTVPSGGTGAGTLTANGILVGNGTSAITSITAGSAGLCLTSTLGSPVWASCTGGGGVLSVNGLTGNLTIANATGLVNTITIDNASTANKGIVQFNATNFSVVAGVADTVQNINTAASPTFSNLTLSGDIAVNGNDITSTGGLNITPAGALTAGSSTQTVTIQGSASSVFKATNGANTTTLSFQTPTANVNYRFATAAAGSYDICTTTGNCTTTSVTTSGGTVGVLPKFTGAQSVGDSLVSESGSVVSVNGDLNLTAGHQYEINGSQISSANLSNDANLAKLNASQTFTGSTNSFQNGSNSATAFAIKNALGTRLLTVNTTAGQVELGQGSSVGGQLMFSNATNNNTITLVSAVATANRTITFPDATGTVCLTSGNCAGVGGGVTTAGGTIGTIPVFTGSQAIGDSLLSQSAGVLVTNGSLNVAGAGSLQTAGTSRIDASGNLVNIGTLTLSGAISGGTTITGSGNINTSGGAIQTNGTSRIDNSGNLVNIGTLSLSGAISGGTTFTGSGNINTTGGALQTNSITRVDNGGNLTNISSLTLSGTISGGTTITGSGNINTSGGAIQTNGTSRIDNSGNLVNIGSITASGSATLQGGNVTLGTTSQAGSVTISDGSSNTGTVQTAALGQNTTYTLPDPGVANVSICLSSGNCSGAAATLQSAYNNSTDPELVLDAVRTGLTIRDNSTPIGANLLEIQNNNGSTTYFAVTTTGTSVTGTIAATGSINSTTGALQTNGTTRIDNSGNLANIGNESLSGSISGGTTVTGSGNFNSTGGAIQTNSTTRIDNSGNLSNIGNLGLSGSISGGTTYSGSGNINTSGGVLQTNSTTRIDNTGNLTNIAALTLSGAISGGTSFTGSGNINTTGGAIQTNSTTRIDNSGNLVNIVAITASGSATLQGGNVTLGTTSQAGSVVINDGSSNTGTVQTAALGQNTVYTLPDPGVANVSICLSSGNCAGAAATLQTAYNNSTDPELVLDAVRGGLTIRDNATPLGANLLEVQNNAGSTTYFGVTTSGVNVTGTVVATGNVNTSGGAIQTNGTTRLDNSGNLSNIGTLTLSGAISGGTTVTGSGNFNTTGGTLQTNSTDRISNSGNLVNIGTLTLSGAISGGTSFTGSGNINTTGGVLQTNSITRLDNSGNLSNIGTLSLSGAISGGTTISGSGNINTSGGAIQTNGTSRIDNSGNLVNIGTITASGSATLQGGNVTLGTTSQAGSVIISDGSSNTGTVQTASLGQNTTYTLPDPGVANVTICLSSGNCSGSAVTLQGAYDNSSSPEITLDATRGALTVRDNSTPIGANLLEIQNNAGSTTYFAVTSSGASVTGTIAATGSINTTTGGLQTNGTTRIDNSGNLSNIGSLSLSGAISGGTTVTGSGNFNTTGGALQTNSTTRVDNSGNLVNIGTITASGSATLQGGSLTLGTTSQAGTIIISDGSSNTGTLQTAALGQNTVYTLPDPGSGTTTICLTSGNCAGAGTGVTSASGGTANTLAKFTTSQNVENSTITDNGTNVTTSADLIVQGGDATIGVSNTQTGTVNFADSGSAFLGSIVQAGLGGNRTYTLPDTTGTFCLSSGNCLGGVGGGANTALSNLTSVAINTSLLPGTAGTVNLGSGSLPLGEAFLAGTSGTPGTNNFKITGASTGGTRVITLPDATGTVCLQSSASCGFAPTSGSTNYIQNQIASAQTADFSISGSGRAATFNATTGLNTGAGAGTQRVDASGNLVNIAALTLTGAISGGTSFTGSGNINTTGGTIQTNSTNRIDNSGNLVNIGAITLSGAISGGTTVTGSGNFNTTGGALQTNSTTRVDNSGNLVNIGAITASGNATLQGGSLTLGTTSQAGTLIINDGSSNTGTLQVAALGQDTVYTLPDPGTGTVSICLTSGNCAGAGGGVTGSGTNNRITKFTSTGSTVGDSTITDNGTNVTTSADLIVQGGDATIGVSNTQTGTVNFADSGSAFLGSVVQGSLGANRTYTLPDASGTFCVSSGNCLGGAGGGANTALSNLTGVAINTTLLPGSAGTVNLGSGTLPFGDAFLAGTSGTPGTNNFKITGASTSGTRVITLPDATGTVCLQSSASCGFAPTSGSTNYIQNQIASAQTADFNISGAGRAATFNATTGINTGAGAGTQRIDASGNLVNIAALTLSGAISGGTSITGSGNINTTGGTIQTNSVDRISNGGNLVNIGSITLSGAISGGTTVTGSGNFNTTGGALQTNSTTRVDNSGNLVNIGSITASGNATLQGGSLTLGTTSQAGTLIINDGASKTGTLQVAALGQNTVYTLPDPGGGTATICLTTGNCTGVGGTVTGSGTNNQLVKFTSTGSTIGDSTLSDNGTTVTTSADFVVQGGDATIGVSSTQTGTVRFADSGSAFLGSITQGTLTAARTYTLPDASGDVCLSSGNCLGPGGTGANINLSNLSSVAINTTLLPGTAGTVSLGSGTLPFGDAFLAGTSGTPGTNNFKITGASTSGTRVITLPDATGTVCLQSSASCGFAPTSGSTNYIQNQIAGAQTADFYISGTGRAATLNGTTGINTGAVAGTQRIDASGNLVNIAALTLTGAISGGTTFTGSGNINSTGGTIQTNSVDRISNGGNLVNIGTVTTSGAINSQTISSAANFTGTLTVQGASITSGTTSQQGSLILHDGNGQTATISVGSALAADTTLAIPTGVGASDTFCLATLANCAGVSGANTALSNLSSVAINTTLLPGAAGTINLGSGTLPFGDAFLAGTSGTPGTNNFKITGASTSGTRVITLPDATGTVCLQSSASCGFAPTSGSTNYIQNQIAGAQTADFYISGTGRAATLNGTTGINTGAVAGTQRIDASGNLVNIGTLTLSGAISGGTSVTGSGDFNTTGGAIQTNSTTRVDNSGNLVNIGTVTTSGAINSQTISSTANFTGTVTVQGANALTLGTTGTNTGTTLFKGSTAASGTITLTLATNNPTNNTISLPNETGTVCTTGSVCAGYAPGSGSTAYATRALDNLTGVAINTTLLPNAAGTINLGSGTLPFGDIFLAGTSGTPGTNNFKITGASTSGLRTITLPDASGTVCLQSAAACGFAPSSGSGNYIQNQIAGAQTADFYISGTGRAATLGATTGINTGAGAGTQRIDASGNLVNIVALTLSGAISGGTSVTGSGNFNSTGGTIQTNSVDRISNGGNLVNIGSLTLTGAISGGTTFTGSGNVNTTGGTIQTNSVDRISNGGNLVNIGTVTTSGAINSQTISSAANFTGTVTIQGANALTVGTTGTSTGAILFKGATGASNTLTLIGPANPTANTLTLPNETGTLCSTGSVCTGYAPASGSTSYATRALDNLASVAINISLLPGSTSIDLGSNASAFRDLYLGGTATNNFRFTGTASAARTYTLDDLSGKVALVQTAGGSSAQTGDLNVSGSLIAATALQGTLFKSADGAGASSGVTFRSGNTTGGSGLSTGTLTIQSGDGSGTNTSSGNVSVDSGAKTGSGTTGSVTIGGTNASALTLGRAGLTTTNAGALTVTQLLTASGGASVAANQNLTLQNGSGVFSQTYVNASAGSAQTLSATNSNAGGSSVAVNGQSITLVGTATSGGINSNSALNFANPAAAANNNFYGLNFAGTGYTDILRVNGTQIINGSGVVQSAGISGSYSNLTGTGTLTSGTLGAGFTTVAATVGGTGQSSYAVGDLLYANTTSTLAKLADVAAGSCLVSGGVNTAPNWASCSGLVTLQNAYNNSTNPEITLGSAATAGLTVRDNASAIAGNLLEIQNNGGGTTYFGVSSTGVSVTGTTSSTGNINTTGGTIQTNSVDRISNGGNLVNIGTVTTSGAINSQTISSTANFTGTVTIQGANALTLGVTGTSTGAVLFKGATGASNTLTLIGPANPTANTLTLPNETGTLCSTGSICAGYAPGTGSTVYATRALDNLTSVAINTSLLTGSSTIDLGSNASAFRDLYLGGTTTNNFRFTGTASAARTYTLDDLNGKVALVQTAGSSSAQTGDLNVSGTLIAGTALQGALVKTADGAGASSGITFRSGNTTAGSGLSTGSVTIQSGDGSGTNTSSGNVSIDSGAKTGSGTNGSITIGGTNALALTLGRAGLTTANAGALTVAQLLTASGGVSVAANQNVTLASGTGVLGQTFVNSVASSAQTLSVTNSNSGGSSVAVNGQSITLIGTATSGGINSNSAINFANPSAAANNNFYGLNFAGTGYTDVLRVNGSQIISGAGKLQNAAIDSTVSYTNLTQVGTLTSGTLGAGFTPVAATVGGTGQTSYAVGDLLYAGTTTTLSKLADVATGSCLTSGGVNTAPTWATCSGLVTLQNAYANGSTISTTGNNIGFTLNTAQSFTVATAAGATGSTTFSLTDGANATPPAQLVLVTNNDINQAVTAGLKVTSAAGTIGTAFDASGTNITNALAIGANAISGTNFSVTGAGLVTGGTYNGQTISSTASFTGTVTVANNLTLTAGDIAVNGGDITSSGALNITPGGTLTVGATTQTLALQGGAGTTLKAVSGANTTTVAFTSPTANTTLNFPALTTGTYDLCTSSGNCAGVGVTLQTAYNNSTDPELTLGNGATKGLSVLDNATPIAGNLFEVQNSGRSTTYFAVSSTGTQTTGTSTSSSNFNTTGGTVQTNSVDRISNGGNLVNIGTITTSGAINSQTISSAANFTGTVTIQGANALTVGTTGTSTGAILFKGSTGASAAITLVGQANPTANTITLPNETGTVCTSAASSPANCTNFAPATGSTVYATRALDNLASVNINAALGFQSNQTANINFNGAAATTGNLLSITGQTAGATANNGGQVTVQGGLATTTGTGGLLNLLGGATTATGTDGGVTIDAGTGATTANGTINIGNANSSTINLGVNNTLTSTIQIGASASTAGTQTINIGNTNTAGGTTNVTIGTGSTASGGTTTVRAKGALTLTGGAASTWDINGTLSLQTTNNGAITTGTGLLTQGGNITFNGTSARTITGPTTGGLTITDATGNLTLSTTGSGTLAATSAGALNLTGAAASTWDIGNNLLSLQTTTNGAITTGTGLLTQGGNITFNGTSARTITGPTTGGLTITDATGNLTLSTTGSGTVAVSSAGALNLTGAAASTLNVGASTLAITSSAFNVTAGGAVSAVSDTLSGANALTLGTTGTNTGAILFKGSTGASSAITLIGQANPTANTITLPNETGTVCTSAATSPATCTLFAPATGSTVYATRALDNLASVNINAALGFQSNQTANINFNGAAATTGNLLSITGQTAGATANNGGQVTVQGGLATTTGTGGLLNLLGGATTTTGTNGGVTIDAGTGATTANGTINLGNANASTINVGVNNTLTSTIQIGASASTAGTQTINIGNTNTAGGTTNVTIGTGSTATGGTTTIRAKAALTLTGGAASTWDIGNNLLSLQTANNGAITTGTGLLTQGGNITFNGTSARTITGPTTGGLTITDATGNLTLSTTGSGTLAATSAGALNLTGAAASTWDIGNNLLSLQTTGNGAITTGTGLLTQGGNITFNGTSARTITGPTTGGLTITDATGNLTLSTTGSGTVAVTSAGALNLTGAAASTLNVGANTLAATSSNFNVATTGVLNVVGGSAGYQIGGTAATGNYLRGNGTSFVSSAIQSSDIPVCTGTCNYISNQTTAQASANFNITSAAAGSIGGQITGAASQTAATFVLKGGTTPGANADLLQLQSSSATVAKFDNAGNFLQNSDGAAAFKLMDSTNTYINLNFDSSTNHLRLYDHTAPRTGYLDLSYSAGVGTISTSSGTLQLGSGAGDVNVSLVNNAEKFNFTHTGTNATSSDTDFIVQRNLTGTTNNLQGAVLKIEDLSTFTSGSSAPDLLLINQNNVSATGNLINAKLGGTSVFSVASTGATTIKNSTNSATAFRIQNASNVSLLTADTSNMRISVGSIGTATGQLYVSGLLPTAAVGTLNTGASTAPGGLHVQGKLAYITNNTTGTMQIVDVSNPASPVSVSTTTIGSGVTSNPGKLYVQGRYAYVTASGDQKLQIFDISNPASPVSMSQLSLGASLQNVTVQGRYAYVTLSNTGFLDVIDVANPSNPVVVGSVSFSTAGYGLHVQGRYAYVTDGLSNGTFKVIDISNPASPVVVSSVSPGASSTPAGVYVQGRYAYVADNSNNALLIYDVKTPTSTPVLAGSLSTGASTGPLNVHVQDRYAYLVNFTSGTMQMVDVSNPASPVSIGTVATGTNPGRIFIQGRYAYVTNRGSNTLTIYDIGGDYVQQLEVGGAEVGTLSVTGDTTLAGSATIQGGLQVGQSLQVSGNVGVDGTLSVNKNSTTALQVANVLGASIVNVDTINTALTVSSNAAAALFASKVDSAAGSTTRGVVTGDFNKDGKTDMAVLDSGTPFMSVFLGNGNGTFLPKVNYTTGTAPMNIIAGDFNKDGAIDLAVNNLSSNTMSIFINNGSGGFAAKVDYATGTSPFSLTTADFDKDGDLDIAVSNQGSTTVSVFFNNGSGVFTLNSSPAAVSNPQAIVAGDFNKDGAPDLAVTNQGGTTVSVLINTGTGTFAAQVGYTVGNNPDGITTADFNKDGILDLAVSNGNSTSVSILLGNGNGTFATKVDYSVTSNAYNLSAGDFNKDGAPDLVVPNYGTNVVSVFINNGNGTFAAKIDYTVGTAPRYAATGDFNSDGNLDIVATNETSGTASVLLNNTLGVSPVATPTLSLYTGGVNDALQIKTADDKKLLSVDARGNTTIGDQSDASTTIFPSKVSYGTNRFTNDVASADVNKDGNIDMLVANNNDNTVEVYLNNGDGTYTASAAYATNTTAWNIATGDFNKDGNIDMAVTDLGIAKVSVFINNGNGTFAAKVDYTTNTGPSGVVVADFNKDGAPDLAVADFSTSQVSVFINSGTGTFAAKVDYTTATSPRKLVAGDFNRDGAPDLAVGSNASSAVSTLLNTGTGTFAAKVDLTTAGSVTGIATADLEKDGDLDLVAIGGNQASVFINNGTGTFATKVDYADSGSTGIVLADLNLDGNIDIATANNSASTGSTLLGSGTGTFATKVNFVTSANGGSITAGDFDKDGDPDVAVLAGNYSFGVYMNNTLSGSRFKILSGDASTAVFSVGTTGTAVFQTSANSSKAFQILNTNNTSLVNVDSSSVNTSNLIAANPSFEGNSVNGWFSYTGCILSAAPLAYNGSYSGSCANDGTGTTPGMGFGLSTTALASTTTYSMSFYAKAATGSFSTLAFGRSDDGATDTSCATGQTVTSVGWTRFNCTFTTGTTSSPYIYIKQTDATTRTWYVDAILVQTTANTESTYRESKVTLNGVVTSSTTFQNTENSTNAFQALNSSGVSQFTIDTTNSRVYIGDPTADSTGALLVLDTKNTSGDPTGVNGAIYYNTGGTGGANTGAGSFQGKLRCFEGNAWKNCIGVRDIVERRWRYAIADNTAGATMGGVGMGAINVTGGGVPAANAQAESFYVSLLTNTTSGNSESAASANAITQLRWLPKYVTRVRADATITNDIYWATLNSNTAAMPPGTPPTGSAAFATSYIGIGYVSTVNSGKWVCASGDGTNNSGTDTGVTVTASHYYDFIVEMVNATTLACSVSDNGGAFVTVTKTTNLPATTTNLQSQVSVNTTTTLARIFNVAYMYVESN